MLSEVPLIWSSERSAYFCRLGVINFEVKTLRQYSGV